MQPSASPSWVENFQHFIPTFADSDWIQTLHPIVEHQKNEQKDRPLGISIHPKLTLFGVTVLVLTLLQDLLELGPEP